MKKVLLSMLAFVASLGMAIADTEVTIPLNGGTFGVANSKYIANGATYTSEDGNVTLTFAGASMHRCYDGYLLMYKSTAAKTTTMTVTANTGVVKSVAFDATFLIGGSFTSDCGYSYTTSDLDASNRPTKALWKGDDASVVFNASEGNANLKSITITLGDPDPLKYPSVKPASGTLYVGINNTVQATAAEGTTVSYKLGEGAYTAMPAEGLSLTESGTYTFRAEKDGQYSAEVVNEYTVLTLPGVAKPSELAALASGTAVKVDGEWTVVGYDNYNGYYFMGDNAGKDCIAVKPIAKNLKIGDVVKAGWVADYTNPSGKTYDKLLTVTFGDLTAASTVTVEPNVLTIPALLADASYDYTCVQVKNLTVTKTANYTYTLTDKDGNTLNSYEQWNSYPALQEGKTYDVTGIAYTDYDVRYLYPESVEEHDASQDDPEPDPVSGTFVFADPTVYGFAAPAEGEATNLANGDKIAAEGIVLTNVQNGVQNLGFFTATNYTAFANNGGVIELQIKNKTIFTFEAPEGKVIKKMIFKGSSLAAAKTFDKGAYGVTGEGVAEWSGDDAVVTLTNGGDFFLSAIDVVLGEPSKVAYPEFSSNGDVLYEGLTTPFTVTLTCATEGATLKYRMAEDAAWVDYTEAGISVTETCTVWAKAVLGSDESSVVTASYTVNPVAKFANEAEFEALTTGDMAMSSAPMTVVYHWKTAYYSVVIASDGSQLFYINESNTCKLDQLEQGDVIAAGVVGTKHAGYMNFSPNLTLQLGTLTTTGQKQTVEAQPIDLTTLATAETRPFHQFLEVKNVKLEQVLNSSNKPLANNYTMSDASEQTMRLYNRFSLDMTTLEDCAYDIQGILVNNGSMDQFWPIALKKVTSVGINAATEAASQKDGKFLEKNSIVIVKNGRKYNAAGQMLK